MDELRGCLKNIQRFDLTTAFSKRKVYRRDGVAIRNLRQTPQLLLVKASTNSVRITLMPPTGNPAFPSSSAQAAFRPFLHIAYTVLSAAYISAVDIRSAWNLALAVPNSGRLSGITP